MAEGMQQQSMLPDAIFDGLRSEPRWARAANPTALFTPQCTPHASERVPSDDLVLPECRLVDCGSVSPTCATTPDDPRLEFEDFRGKVDALVREFFCVKDVQGMVSSITALESQCFHDELVTVLLRTALDRKESDRNATIALLNVLADGGHVSTTQLVRGYEKLVLIWEDLRLDVPDSPGQLVGLLSSKVGLYDKDLFERLPEGLLQCVCDGFAPGMARDTLQEHVEALKMFKKEWVSQLESNIDADDSFSSLATWLREKDMAAFHHEVVLAACIAVVELPVEMAAKRQKSVLDMFTFFSTISTTSQQGPLLSEADLHLGFSRLLGKISNLAKVNPDALKSSVSIFRGAVEQELLAADFLKTTRRLRYGGPQGVQVLREAQRQTPAFSRRVWGTGDKRQLQTETREAILEYFDSGSIEELGQIVGELHLSEKDLIKFLRKLLVSGMESGQQDKALDAIKGLLGFFWSASDVQEAFDELQGIADDLVLDLPQCREQTDNLMKTAHGRGLLEESYLHTACISAV